MKVSLKWLKEYVDINDDYKLIEDKFNLMSQEVESLYKLVEATNLVIGEVLTCEKHPNAEKLSLTTVDVGKESPLQIICGAPNVAAGQKVIVALDGAILPDDFKIKKSKIRGVESNGMICSLDELGIKDFEAKETGIYVLNDDAIIGKNPLEYLSVDDYTLDLDLTANRPDLLSVEGVAYDTACMLDKEISLKEHKYEKTKVDNYLSVYTDTSKCLAYYGQVIDNIKIKESPYWMKSRLLASGIRPINNVVDITNYVMLEYGQPLHAFDYNKLNSDKILVRKAKPEEKIVTLDEQTRELVDTDIVISTDKKAVAIAGVMGGLDTEVDESTTKILLESAYFDPTSVRVTSKRLDLKSESSSRFEKGINPNNLLKALNYATELFVKLADGLVIGNYGFFDNTDKEPHEVELSIEKLNHVTGNTFSLSEVEAILKRLKFKYRLKSNTFIVEIPTRRQNVYGYQDLIEEIVRIYGYNKIPTSIPKTPTSGYLTKTQKLRRIIRNYFVNLGFNETVTYSLVKDEEVKEFDIEEKSVVTIMNPINKERSALRHSILPSLLNVLSYNKSRKIQDVFLFEIGRGYTNESEGELLSGLMHGLFNSSLWQGKKENVDFYLLKGIIEGLLKKLKINNYEIIKAKNKIASMHPGIYAELYIENKYVGLIGKLHPQKEHDLDVNKTYIFELSLDEITKNYNLDLIMEEIPKYPAVTRDLALVLNKDIMIDSLIKEVKLAGKKTLKSVDIFDVYEGDNIDDDKKSVALSLVLQSNEKTLEAKEVDIVINRILKQLETKLNAKLR